ncbi:MAG: ABC-2 family transporter protein [Anaerolineaceae bacterium]|nr:ABC-2 family transporter protein [Anaerolineaceae bacterium]
MHALRLTGLFLRASLQEEVAYRANFWIHLLNSLLNLGTGIAGVAVLFDQVQNLRGWDFPAALALLGVYLSISALRGLVIGPSLDALAGMDGEIWRGVFDFTLLRPVSTQFYVSLRRWDLFALFDLALGCGVIAVAVWLPGQALPPAAWVAFVVSLLAGVIILYALLLAFTALVFWSPGFMFTWVFDALFQMARYPVDLYPGWLRLALTWVIPVGLMTTFPAQALAGRLPLGWAAAGAALALVLLAAASLFFHGALRRYASASS